MILDRKKIIFEKKVIFGVWGAIYVILLISGVRFGEIFMKINDQHLIVNGADVRDHDGLGY